jgi:hypothetical protein
LDCPYVKGVGVLGAAIASVEATALFFSKIFGENQNGSCSLATIADFQGVGTAVKLDIEIL